MSEVVLHYNIGRPVQASRSSCVFRVMLSGNVAKNQYENVLSPINSLITEVGGIPACSLEFISVM